jgi:two-component system chemotaxis response regulator CheB
VDALQKIPSLDPDVVTLDVEMPGLDGLGTLRCIMSRFPRPVIMVSAATENNAETTFTALGAGAFDYVPKHLSSTSLEIAHIRADLVAKIRAAALARTSHSDPSGSRKPPQPAHIESAEATSDSPEVVAIGTSTGGPRALQEILPRFGRDLPVPLLIVQHMPVGFTAPFARRLNTLCSIPVREATNRELVRPGVAYIAPSGTHMRVQRRLCDAQTILYLDPSPEDALHIPSVDVLMLSAAEAFKNRAMGVILTGMGSDGAEGITAIYRQGGLTIGQDEASCAVYGMPRACSELGVLNRIVPLSDVPTQILLATRRRKRA